MVLVIINISFHSFLQTEQFKFLFGLCFVVPDCSCCPPLDFYQSVHVVLEIWFPNLKWGLQLSTEKELLCIFHNSCWYISLSLGLFEVVWHWWLIWFIYCKLQSFFQSSYLACCFQSGIYVHNTLYSYLLTILNFILHLRPFPHFIKIILNTIFPFNVTVMVPAFTSSINLVSTCFILAAKSLMNL